MTNETKKRIRTEFVVQTIGKQAALLAEQYATAPLSHTGRTAEEANRARCDLLKMTIGGLAGEFPDLAGVAKAEETAAQLIRAIYDASPEENKVILLGYARLDGEMVLFTGDQNDIQVTLTDKDKLIVFCNH